MVWIYQNADCSFKNKFVVLIIIIFNTFSIPIGSVPGNAVGLTSILHRGQFLPARRYASAGTSYGPVSVCVCVCLCVTSRSSIETAEWIELVFGMRASFQLSYTLLKRNSVTLNIRVLSSGTLSNLEFCFGISIVEMCYRLSTRKVDAPSVINWTVVGQLSWQYLRAPTLDPCSLQWSPGSVYSTIPSRGSIGDSWYLSSWIVTSKIGKSVADWRRSTSVRWRMNW